MKKNAYTTEQKRPKEKLLNLSIHCPSKKNNSGDQEIQALIPTSRKIQLPQWFFPHLKNPTTAQHAHDHIITCSSHVARTEQFTVIFWPPGGLKLLFLLLLKWDLPQIRSIPITNLQHNPWAKWSFPIFFPQKKTRLQRASSIFSQQETPLTHLLGGQLVDVSTYVLGKYFSPISRSGYSKPFWVVGITILGELLAKWLLNI